MDWENIANVGSLDACGDPQCIKSVLHHTNIAFFVYLGEIAKTAVKRATERTPRNVSPVVASEIFDAEVASMTGIGMMALIEALDRSGLLPKIKFLYHRELASASEAAEGGYNDLVDHWVSLLKISPEAQAVYDGVQQQ